MATKTLNKKVLILESAKRLFSKYGLKKTTVDEIARETNIAKGTVYNYFRTKEKIFSVVVKSENDILINKIISAINTHQTSCDKIKAFVLTKIRYYKEAVVLYNINRAVIEELLPDLQKLRNNYFRQEARIVEDILKEGISKREIKKVMHVDVIAKSLLISLKEMESPWVFEKDIKEVEVLLDVLLKILFYGIANK